MHTDRGSLAFGVPAAAPGTLHTLSISGSISAGPVEGRRIVFGRNWDEVDLCIGGHDQGVSRTQGTVSCRAGRWWLTNSGRRPLRMPGSRMLFTDEEPIPLAAGYLPLFVRGSGSQEHLLELYVSDGESDRTTRGPAAPTTPPRTYRLSATERLALVVLAQRYLLQEPYPQPISRDQAAEQLHMLQPDGEWTERKVERLARHVRDRLSAAGTPGLMREEVGEPVGNMLNHNLIRELIDSTTLVPPDLRLIDIIDE
ncbi:hypothetical protein [Nocardia macrotermitis]|uniref:FHA domain-containing protein n=1 Tax=Nocardia macrotermitis TaxID=2585198 RepID=A0A7K0CUL3_9NOCA|nr:hypothetical protein [Nocardia macrotermitis]MQY17073.1 hypothetical protein [Nocardia macrotermitis]